jgi:hypothetical protein
MPRQVLINKPTSTAIASAMHPSINVSAVNFIALPPCQAASLNQYAVAQLIYPYTLGAPVA